MKGSVNKQMEKEFAITTIDNPFDPFDQFDEWFLYDETNGYHTSSYLARIARTSESFTDKENRNEIERAIDEIIRFDFEGIYKKVSREIDTNL